MQEEWMMSKNKQLGEMVKVTPYIEQGEYKKYLITHALRKFYLKKLKDENEFVERTIPGSIYCNNLVILLVCMDSIPNEEIVR